MQRSISTVVPANKVIEGAGVPVLRTIGIPTFDHLDPFLLLDEFNDPNPARSPGIPWHPHRGFETVTLLLEGTVHHEDAAGGRGTLEAGDVQWMTAGRGIVHQEMPDRDSNPVRGLQLWINLPSRNKMCRPAYQNVHSASIPVVSEDGANVRVIAGRYVGTRGAADTRIPINVLDVTIEPDAVLTLDLDEGHNAVAYVLDGVGLFGEPMTIGHASNLVVTGHGDELRVRSERGVRFILLSARPIGEPVARHGPFVMNTRTQLIQAYQDYQAGRLMAGATQPAA